MRGTDAGAGQHGDRGFRNHGEVDRYAIAFLYPQSLQGVGELTHLPMEAPVGVYADVARLSLPDQGGLVPAWPVKVPIQAVVGDVELSPHKPLGVRGFPLEDCMPPLEPIEFFRPRLPKREAILGGALIYAAIRDFGAFHEIRGGREPASLSEEYVQSLILRTHTSPPRPFSSPI